MKTKPKQNAAVRLAGIFFIIALSFTAIIAQPAAPPCVVDLVTDDAVKEWNCRAITKVVASVAGNNPLRQVRAMAVVQLSVSNAVNGITGEYETYLPHEGEPPADGSLDGAAIGAAYQALIGLFGADANLDAAFNASLLSRGIPADDPGVLYGRAAASNIAALRSTDGSGAPAACAYTDIPNPLPGQWRRINNAPAAIPCWGAVTPFALRSGSQFPMEAPPSLTSDLYTRDFLEVKALGGNNADTQRDAPQTALASFFDGNPAPIWNQAIRQASDAQDLDISTKARNFALVYMAGTDASIACWVAKYEYLFWRPETAVNLAGDDGNPGTEPLPNGVYWAPFIASHAHPEYPSGHATVSSGLASAAALVFGDKPGVAMTPTIIRNNVAYTRSWDSFSEGIDEVISARVYSGLHFRFTDEASARLGSQVSRFAFTHVLRQCTEGKKCG